MLLLWRGNNQQLQQPLGHTARLQWQRQQPPYNDKHGGVVGVWGGICGGLYVNLRADRFSWIRVSIFTILSISRLPFIYNFDINDVLFSVCSPCFQCVLKTMRVETSHKTRILSYNSKELKTKSTHPKPNFVHILFILFYIQTKNSLLGSIQSGTITFSFSVTKGNLKFNLS